MSERMDAAARIASEKDTLPDRPVLAGDVYAQWAWIPNPASSNATPVATTRGLQLQIR